MFRSYAENRLANVMANLLVINHVLEVHTVVQNQAVVNLNLVTQAAANQKRAAQKVQKKHVALNLSKLAVKNQAVPLSLLAVKENLAVLKVLRKYVVQNLNKLVVKNQVVLLSLLAAKEHLVVQNRLAVMHMVQKKLAVKKVVKRHVAQKLAMVAKKVAQNLVVKKARKQAVTTVIKI